MRLSFSAGSEKGEKMTLRLPLLGLLGHLLILGGTGCSHAPDKPQPDKTKVAVERVMKADQKLMEERDKLPPQATPSQMAWAVGSYCDALEHLDMTDCPADFRVAYKQHMRAWREVLAALQQLPDGFLEGVLVGAVNALLRGEIDGGATRLEGDLKQAIERVRTTWEEVEKIGARYGVAL
jgi:hypothetical protein